MKIQLTISLLVSDRMETLGRCLASLKPLLRELDSELIIVYTGKDPDTLALAKQYTSHIIPFAWCNDFSKARNVGLKEAKGEWFLYLDDDEWFEDTSELIRFFKSGEYRSYQSAEYIQRNYLDWEGASYSDAYVGRMCRLLSGTHFVYPIHENLKPYPEPCKRFEAFVHHFGYVGKKDSKEQNQKSDRNLSLLLERMKKEPPSDHLYAQLAQEYAGIRRYDEAIRYCREGIALAGKGKKGEPLEMWLELKLPIYISYTGDLALALAEGEEILAMGRLSEVGEVNLAVLLVEFCHRLKEFKKGLKYVRMYRERLEYLEKRPDKAMAQNGITETFAGAKVQATSVYIRGLYFASEIGDPQTIEWLLSCFPWEDTAQLLPQYGSLDAWKGAYGDQRLSILESYAKLKADNSYVQLQKAYYAESQKETEEMARIWARCAKDCPAGFQDQLVRMAVRNGMPFTVLLERMSLEEWDGCVGRLADALELPEMPAFYQRILPELAEYPIFAERVKQRFLKRQLTQGLLEASHFRKLLEDYCESVVSDTEMIYRKEILEDPDSCVLPGRYKFAVIIQKALALIEAGSIGECVPLLREALYIFPQMSAAVSQLTRYLNDKMKELERPVSPEFAALGGQVKQMLAGLMESGQWNEAYGVVGQLVTLLPEDMEVLRMKQEIVCKL